MTNNIIIAKNEQGETKVIFSSAETETEARKMANDQGDEFISFIPIESSIMLDSCVVDEGYRITIEAFLTNLYTMGVEYGANQMKK